MYSHRERAIYNVSSEKFFLADATASLYNGSNTYAEVTLLYMLSRKVIYSSHKTVWVSVKANNGTEIIKNKKIIILFIFTSVDIIHDTIFCYIIQVLFFYFFLKLWLTKFLFSAINTHVMRMSYNGYYLSLPSWWRGFDSHHPLKTLTKVRVFFLLQHSTSSIHHET